MTSRCENNTVSITCTITLPRTRWEEEEYAEPVINVITIKRAKSAGSLCQQPDNSTGNKIERKMKAVHLIVAVCDKKKTVKHNHIWQRAKLCLPIKDALFQTKHKSLPSLDQFPSHLHATQYPDCVGDGCLCEKRSFTYCRQTAINDQFDDQHLAKREQAKQSSERIRYEHLECRDVRLQHLEHYRSHLQKVYGGTLRTSR
jgi:hypothetical protein